GLTEPIDECLQCLFEAAETIAHQEKVALLIVKDFEQKSRPVLAFLEKQGFCRLEGLPLTEMTLDFKTFDQYLAKLSYASRYDLRRKFRKVDGKINISFEVLESLSGPLLKEAHALYRQAVDTHELGFETMPETFFENIGKNMPGRAKFFLWRVDGKPAGFAFCLVEGGLFVDYYVGFDYKIAHTHHLFFIRFRDLLNWCLQNGMTRYEMGYTSYEVKRRLGFGLLPMDIYVKHRGKIVNRLVGFFVRRLHFERFDPALREFKEKWHDKK
ncbi:MAG: GNAT family N-acetyltransferase, partial [Candidatus Omnitrophota bacterium]